MFLYKRGRIGRGLALLVGIAYGAGMMYLLDPDVGPRRRVMVRDHVLRLRREARRRLLSRLRHAGNELRGLIFESRSRLREDRVPDNILERRVRAQIGHIVSRPHLLEVAVRNGHVTIRGFILPGERERIQDRLSVIRGAREWTLDASEQPQPGRAAGSEGERPQPQVKTG